MPPPPLSSLHLYHPHHHNNYHDHLNQDFHHDHHHRASFPRRSIRIKQCCLLCALHGRLIPSYYTISWTTNTILLIISYTSIIIIIDITIVIVIMNISNTIVIIISFIMTTIISNMILQTGKWKKLRIIKSWEDSSDQEVSRFSNQTAYHSPCLHTTYMLWIFT